MLFSSSHCSPLSADIDMKKDIETLIAEERADIILKYATVSLRLTEISVERSPSDTCASFELKTRLN